MKSDLTFVPVKICAKIYFVKDIYSVRVKIRLYILVLLLGLGLGLDKVFLLGMKLGIQIM